MNQNQQPSKAKLTVIMLVFLAAIGLYLYFYFMPEGNTETTNNGRTTPDPVAVTNDEDPLEGLPDEEEATVSADETATPINMDDWELVEGDGYEFRHPGYFIKEENGYYIMAYEPLMGSGEFSGMSIQQPIVIDDIEMYMQEHIQNSESSVGITVTKEPQRISMPGFDTVYSYEYELESGYNTGAGKFFAYETPDGEMWVIMEYPVHETTEAIKDSFRFVDQ